MSRTYSAGIVTAYGSALSGGYTGTYEEFCDALGDLANVLTEFEHFSVTVATLPAGSSATASYLDGVLYLGIPKGDKGDQGETGATGATGNGISNIVKTGTAGLVDTYTINYTNGSQATFQITNGEKGDTGATGNGIVSITKTSTSGNVDTYTVLYTNGNTDTITVTNGSVTSVNGLTGDVVLDADDIAYDTDNSVKDELDIKANVDGYYEDLTAGNAEQIVSSIKVTDLSPYNFRTSGGALDIGNRETVKKLIGCSLGWNQLIKSLSSEGWTNEQGVTSSFADGVATVNNSGSTNNGIKIRDNINFVAGHKYFLTGEVKCETEYTNVVIGTTATIGVYINGITTTSSWAKYSAIKNCATSSYGSQFYLYRQGGNYSNLQFRNVMCIDLTLAFTPTIADYIYSLESANTGDGVAWFRKYFPKSYYANGQSLESVYTSQHKMVGFNQWDEEYEEGEINASSGENTESSIHWRAKNYIPIFPNTTYRCTATDISSIYVNLRPRFYDANKNYLGYVQKDGTQVYINQTFVSPENAYFMRFALPISSVPMGTKMCINLHWDGERDGEYEAYDEHVYNLEPVILRGIPKLDSNNNLYYEGDTYESDGTVTRNYGIVNLGTLAWSDTSSNDPSTRRMYTRGLESLIKPVSSNNAVGNLKCAIYDAMSADSTFLLHEGISVNTSGYVIVYDPDYITAESVDAFETAMDGVYLVYELATPTTESADSYPSIQIVDNWGTEQYVDYAVSQNLRDVEIPVGSETDYPISLKDKLETLADVPDGDGLYLLKQESGENTYVQYVSPIPSVPSEDGTYVLKATVSGGVATVSWVSES